MSGTRRLAAIMFIDVAGFTALTQTDEKAALALVREQEALLAPLLRRFRGRKVKSTGDGLLLEFPNALDAVELGVAFQRQVHERNRRETARPLPVRVGIHLGDVQREGNDILGDTVNICSRVERFSEIGGVCLTAPVYDQVHNKVSYEIARLGPRELRGVRDPVTLYHVVLPWARGEGSVGSPTVPRLAVLPLTNISPNPKDAYFADGLTEELVSVLSRLQGLRVVARSAVSPYKGAPKPVHQVGAELGVSSVLEGSVRKAGSRLRVSLQLVDVSSQEPTWSETYDRELDDVFVVQSDIANRTAQALKLELTRGERGATRRPTSDLKAYDLYLRGLVAGQRLDPKGLEEAAHWFEEATTRDPTFAEAFAAWANLYVIAAGDFVPMSAVMPKARELARRAAELDPLSSEAHSALANFAFQYDHDWETAEAEFKRAIELNPSNPTALRFCGTMLMALRRFDEAREVVKAAIRLDPGGPYQRTLAFVDLTSGNFDAAIEFEEAEVERHPERVGGHVYLGLVYLTAGRRAEALREAETPLTGADDTERFDLALLNALLGRPDAAREVAAKVERGEAESYTSATHLALLYAAIGEGDRALDLLEKDLREGDHVFWSFYQGIWFDQIRTHPRFLALLRRYGLPSTPPFRANAVADPAAHGPPRGKRTTRKGIPPSPSP